MNNENLRKKLLKELRTIAFANGIDYAEYGTESDVPKNKRAAVKEVNKNGIVLYDKFKAIELLGKNCGLFRENAGEARSPVVIIDDVSKITS
jgi:hypothetical protein